MKLNQLLQRLFGAKQKKEMKADNSEKMQKVMAMLANTQEVELTCDEVFAVLDQFVEMAARGEDVSQLMPLIQQHLDMCEDCREEYMVLEKIVMNAA